MLVTTPGVHRSMIARVRRTTRHRSASSNRRPAFFAVAVADDAPISTKPYFSRAAFTENRYTLSDPSSFGRPFNPPPLVAVAQLLRERRPGGDDGVVKRREPNLPYGDVAREVRTVPRIGVSVSPTTAVIPLTSTTRTVNLDVALVHNASRRRTDRSR